MVIWSGVAGFLIVGYLSAPRSFAYIGFPPVFIGEIVLGAFLLFKPRVALGTWMTSLLRASPLNPLGISLLLFMSYGVWQVDRGVLNGSPVVETLKYFVFNYYALYIFFGIWIAMRAPEYLPKLVRIIAWVNGIYGLAYVVALRDVAAYIPGSHVSLFSPPAGQVVAILGLLCFERDLRAVWFVLLLNIILALVWQVRADWLGLALGMFVWGFLTGRLGRVVALGMAGLAVLGLIELIDILPGRTGSDVTLSENLARAIAPIDLELAKEFSPNAKSHAGTAEWRELWWDAIWRSVHSSPRLEAFGHGYGFDLFSLSPLGVPGSDLRTPHSVFYYALGYTGWVGVALFATFQATILRLLWRSYRNGGQPAGVVFWVMGMAISSFAGGFETPSRAIPLYVLWGMAIAPGLQAHGELGPRPARSRLLSVAEP